MALERAASPEVSLAAAQPLRDPLLLVGFTIVDGVWRDRAAVMVVVVYLPARAVLFAVYLLLLLIGQRAAIGNTIIVHLPIDAGLSVFGAGGFAGGHLTGAEAIGDALVLIGLHANWGYSSYQ